jgi:hypothetical protein
MRLLQRKRGTVPLDVISSRTKQIRIVAKEPEPGVAVTAQESADTFAAGRFARTAGVVVVNAPCVMPSARLGRLADGATTVSEHVLELLTREPILSVSQFEIVGSHRSLTLRAAVVPALVYTNLIRMRLGPSHNQSAAAPLLALITLEPGPAARHVSE